MNIDTIYFEENTEDIDLINAETPTETATEKYPENIYFLGDYYSKPQMKIIGVVGLIVVLIIIRIIFKIKRKINNFRQKHPTEKSTFNEAAKEFKKQEKKLNEEYWEDIEHLIHKDLINLKADFIDGNEAGTVTNIDKKCSLYGSMAFNDIYLRDIDDDYEEYDPSTDKEFEHAISQIDEIVLSKKAIYFIECKTYSGNVRGDINEKYWLHNGIGFYSPIFQNQGHINFFKCLCEKKAEFANANEAKVWEHAKELPMYNIICFSNKTDVNVTKNSLNNVKVVKERELISVLMQADEKLPTSNMTTVEYMVLGDKLKECCKNVPEHIKKAHLTRTIQKEEEI